MIKKVLYTLICGTTLATISLFTTGASYVLPNNVPVYTQENLTSITLDDFIKISDYIESIPDLNNYDTQLLFACVILNNLNKGKNLDELLVTNEFKVLTNGKCKKDIPVGRRDSIGEAFQYAIDEYKDFPSNYYHISKAKNDDIESNNYFYRDHYYFY